MDETLSVNSILMRVAVVYFGRDSFLTVTASWHESCRKVSAAMHARRWSSAVLRRHTTKLKPSQRCFLVKGTLSVYAVV